jgi:hypothetical protein
LMKLQFFEKLGKTGQNWAITQFWKLIITFFTDVLLEIRAVHSILCRFSFRTVKTRLKKNQNWMS